MTIAMVYLSTKIHTCLHRLKNGVAGGNSESANFSDTFLLHLVTVGVYFNCC